VKALVAELIGSRVVDRARLPLIGRRKSMDCGVRTVCGNDESLEARRYLLLWCDAKRDMSLPAPTCPGMRWLGSPRPHQPTALSRDG